MDLSAGKLPIITVLFLFASTPKDVSFFSRIAASCCDKGPVIRI